MTENDPVHRPAHYANSGIEVANFIADRHLDYFLGNVVKYVSRAGIKSAETELEDLKKARAYLDMRIRITQGLEPIDRPDSVPSEKPSTSSAPKLVVEPVKPRLFGNELVIPNIHWATYTIESGDGIFPATGNDYTFVMVPGSKATVVAYPTEGYDFVKETWEFSV